MKPVDYIIVGGGTSGCVLAGRLSEVPDWSVLVLEGGDFENDFTDIPGLYYLLQNTKYNWGYNSTKQNNICLGEFTVPIRIHNLHCSKC